MRINKDQTRNGEGKREATEKDTGRRKKEEGKRANGQQDRLEGLMIETNYKYGSLVAMMAKMNERNGKGMQMEGHMTPILSDMTPILSDGGPKIFGTGNSSTQGNGRVESHAE
ncbi:Hypothetical predicted protein [Olea europaea subsp. europaea]|uniref:Uncharacterized protein n=1 Tax=Olea europaea subsp. europaea TaxID=158383 RepID=A0A8S0V3T5_OLEEU|nr:Hypothetical predicted protein [Olea europaea subsp. europaea]